MVFEQLFAERWIERKPLHAFMLGMFYSFVGIISARIVFGANPGLMAVAFTSLLLIPSLNKLLQKEENVEIREKKLSARLLIRDHWDIFIIYLFLFFGIFFTFSMTALFVGATSEYLFNAQLSVAGLSGAAFNTLDFESILINNLIVLIVCFLLSLIYGAGSILFITWNASVWGAIFGYLAALSAATANQHPFLFFMLTIIPVLPHMVTESVSYISAAIVGGVVSKAMLRETLGSEKFKHVLTDAIIFLLAAILLIIVAAFIEVALFA